MRPTSSLTPEERANLIAYLDGELDPQAADRLKAKLEADPGARAEAEMLQKTWGLLDLLPRPQPSPTFTTRTLQRVSVVIPVVPPKRARRWRPWVIGIGWGMALAVAGTLGYAGGRLRPQPSATPVNSAASTSEKPVALDPHASERTWLEHLPRGDRERVLKMKGTERAKLIKTLHEQERTRDQEWQRATRHWDELLRGAHTHLNRLPPPVKIYVDDFLRPLLSKEEEQQLLKVNGTQQLLPTLLSLTKKHSVILPGPTRGTSGWLDLPADFRQKLTHGDNGGLLLAVRQSRRVWPDFAVWVTYLAHHEQIAVPWQLGPCRPGQFDAKTRKFIHALQAKLRPTELARLRKAEGNWPLYPRLLAELAAHHDLTVPGGARLHLPGSAEFWSWAGEK